MVEHLLESYLYRLVAVRTAIPIGEVSIHGLNLDWKRFNTSQVSDFCAAEIAPLKAENPSLPTTTNFMEYFYDYDYWQLAKVIDFISWDSYPLWHNAEDDCTLGAYTAMYHDLMRTLKGGKPFYLMESTPSLTNWQPISKLKSRACISCLHFRLSHTGQTPCSISSGVRAAVPSRSSTVPSSIMSGISTLALGAKCRSWVTSSTNSPQWQAVGWTPKSLSFSTGKAAGQWITLKGRATQACSMKTVTDHYRTFWEQGVAVDIINADVDLSGYQVVIAPMLYMVRDGFAERVDAFVKQGGRFVTTYWSGVVNETDLCHQNGFPGPLRPIMGIWAEEIDGLYDHESNSISGLDGNEQRLVGPYQVTHLCELIHLEGARALATYDSDFYVGRPAVTVNDYGKGQAYYIASRNDPLSSGISSPR